MTETAAEGSVEAGTPETAPVAVSGTEGSTPETSSLDPFSGLDEDTRSWVGTKGIKDVASLAKLARNEESLIGKAIVPPGENAAPEEVSKFWNRLGRPETPDGYEFAPPESMPESLPYDSDFAKWFKDEAHKANVPKSQAKSLHDAFVAMSVDRITKETQARVDKANADLVAAWGPRDSQAYQENLKLADRGLTVGGDDLAVSLQRAGFLGPNKEILDGPVAKFLASVGKHLGTEGQFVTGGGAIADNPFSDGASFNMTEQMRIAKSDPNRARMLIRAAGKSARDFGLPET